MKLANIYEYVNGSLKGQAAVGTSDANCLDVKFRDSNGITRDIKRIVYVDSSLNQKIITKRLETQTTEYYKYVTGQLICPDGNAFNSNSTESVCQLKIDLTFRLNTIGQKSILVKNAPASGTYYELFINSSNQLSYTCAYNGNSRTLTWNNWTFSANTWYTLSFYLPPNNTNNYNAYASIDGSSYVSKNTAYYSFAVTNVRDLIVSNANMSLRNTISIIGTSYTTKVRHTLLVDVEDATAGSALNLTYGNYTLSGGTVYSVGSSSSVWVQ